jgi:5-formyltetrahydrofolate cyclo-ligase
MSLPPSHQDKGALRRSLLAVRRGIDDRQRHQWDVAICTQLEHWLSSRPVGSLGIYWSIQNEPNLLPTYVRLAERGVRLFLPVVASKGKPLQFAAWTPGDAISKDAFGVPVPEQKVFGPYPDALLIPCVGFDHNRFRLGYGGGFYDRTLAVSPRPIAIGIAYACQQTTFEADPHDIALDVIITESRPILI